MNGTELRSFSHFQILTWIAYLALSRNLENWLIWCLPSFPVKLWKSVKMIKFEYKHDSEALSWWMEQNQEVLVIFKYWPKSHTWTLAENLKIDYFWSFSSFTVKLWKSVKMIKFKCKLDFTSGFLMNGTELRSLSHFQILTWIAYSDLSRNLENWLILMFAFIPCETVKVSEDDQIRI